MHLEIEDDAKCIFLGKRRFIFVDQMIHLSHLIDSKNRLLGFAISGPDDLAVTPEWEAWWNSFDNRELQMFYVAIIYLTGIFPADCEDDGASLIGAASVYADGLGEYVLLVPDFNGTIMGSSDTPIEFWKEIGFPLHPIEVSACS